MIAPKLISLLKNPSSKDLAIISIIDGFSWRNRIARIKPTILARKPAKNPIKICEKNQHSKKTRALRARKKSSIFFEKN